MNCSASCTWVGGPAATDGGGLAAAAYDALVLLTAAGFDPIWFGVVIVLVTEMGVITPPVGVNVFVIKGIAPDIPMEKIFKGIWPFLVALILFTIVLMFVPQLATFLPQFITY